MVPCKVKLGMGFGSEIPYILFLNISGNPELLSMPPLLLTYSPILA